MKPMPPEVKTNQQLMREYIQRERRVELFYEGKRPWTCRLYLEPTSKEELARKAFGNRAGVTIQNVHRNTGLPITVHCLVASE